MDDHPRLLITPGEPAGIGPDITLQLAQQSWPTELVVIADPALLMQRAQQLGLSVTLKECDLQQAPELHQAGTLKIIPISLNTIAEAGNLNPANADYVIRTLKTAASLCHGEKKRADAIVTGPVHKGVINEAGIAFTGHTEFFAQYCRVPQTVMLFVADQLKVALATTHLPLAKVPEAITKAHLRSVISTLQAGLKQQFRLESPRIAVCGLNPHAGEGGHLGREEIETITPLLAELREQHYDVIGPLPADTIFTPKHLQEADVVLAMYHDQALPLVKYIGFGHAVNVTLGLPFVRTSVDHGTALDVAGTNRADAGSMMAAVELAIRMIDG
ncbi:MAG: 4-hydroxythreonine-4-phosphate dehydrogenase PdxA [Gammaproteobacteria bacterium]|nr:MAG: 4-hydroxythreonine-4-phosphate dehydrogenase PdxA [Gammaproteobacteria bacterium]